MYLREVSVDDSFDPEEFEEEKDIILIAVTNGEKSPFGRHFELQKYFSFT